MHSAFLDIYFQTKEALDFSTEDEKVWKDKPLFECQEANMGEKREELTFQDW